MITAMNRADDHYSNTGSVHNLLLAEDAPLQDTTPANDYEFRVNRAIVWMKFHCIKFRFPSENCIKLSLAMLRHVKSALKESKEEELKGIEDREMRERTKFNIELATILYHAEDPWYVPQTGPGSHIVPLLFSLGLEASDITQVMEMIHMNINWSPLKHEAFMYLPMLASLLELMGYPGMWRNCGVSRRIHGITCYGYDRYLFLVPRNKEDLSHYMTCHPNISPFATIKHGVIPFMLERVMYYKNIIQSYTKNHYVTHLSNNRHEDTIECYFQMLNHFYDTRKAYSNIRYL